jgi:hypothetical protein
MNRIQKNAVSLCLLLHNALDFRLLRILLWLLVLLVVFTVVVSLTHGSLLFAKVKVAPIVSSEIGLWRQTNCAPGDEEYQKINSGKSPIASKWQCNPLVPMSPM